MWVHFLKDTPETWWLGEVLLSHKGSQWKLLSSKAAAFKKGPTDLPYQNHQESLLKMQTPPSLPPLAPAPTKSEFPQELGVDREESYRFLHLLLGPWDMQPSGLP